ncbi:MAG TPA: hypothetical protein VGN26_18060, partial [Armatimonadota bacterium]
VTAKTGGTSATKMVTVGVVPPPAKGLRPESFFASNTNDKGHNEFDRRIGLKVFRQHWADEWSSLSEESRKPTRRPEDPLTFNFSAQEAELERARKADISVLGIVGYANPEWARTEEAQRLRMYGPPRSHEEFIRATVPVVKHFTGIRTWEFWNEPWIYGWTWAGSASEFGDLQAKWSAAAREARPDIRILGGHSASFLADHLADSPDLPKVLDGGSNHPYKEGERPNYRQGSQLRYTDYGVQVERRAGLGLHYITENGTEVPGERDNPLNAPKVVQLHVMPALAGVYQANVQEGIGWGLDQMKGAVAYGVMTSFLEDRVVVADIWPSQPLLWGAVFANASEADRKAPRADALSARWQVKSRLADTTKVAVVWSNTGPDADHLDSGATLLLKDAGSLEAFDLMGAPVGQRQEGALTLPLSHYPIYITTNLLSAAELSAKVAVGTISGATPVSLSVNSLTRPMEQGGEVSVRVQNQLNRRVQGKVSVQLPEGWEALERSLPITLAPAELAEVTFRLRQARMTAGNQYAITAVAETDAGAAKRSQVVSVAYAPKLSPKVDGNLSDWSRVSPMTCDSQDLGYGDDLAKYLLNPSLKRPETPKEAKRVRVSGYTAWDDDRLYLAFEVKEPGLVQSFSGASDSKTGPWGQDCIEVGFGLKERAGDDFHAPGDPWYWKGIFRDTDYLYLLTQTASGPKLYRLTKPGVEFRVPWQTHSAAWQVPVEGSQIVIRRDEMTGTTCYEASLPRKEIPDLDPAKAGRIRYGYVAFNDEGAGPGGKLQWAQAAGVFDYWLNHGSFMPTWESLWPCQTYLGMGP